MTMTSDNIVMKITYSGDDFGACAQSVTFRIAAVTTPKSNDSSRRHQQIGKQGREEEGRVDGGWWVRANRGSITRAQIRSEDTPIMKRLWGTRLPARVN